MDWGNITLDASGNFFTTEAVANSVGGNARALSEGLQIADRAGEYRLASLDIKCSRTPRHLVRNAFTQAGRGGL
jgi:hypothetical protein